MNTHDQPRAAAPTLLSPVKRAYQTPRVIDLGDVREVTRGSTGTVFDGPGSQLPPGGSPPGPHTVGHR
jgi:hypothetical protein